MSAKAKPSGTGQMTEEKREQVRSLLRNIDRYIKEAKLTEAREELAKLRALDPKNVYASAFEERLTFLEQQPTPPDVEKEQKPSIVSAGPPRERKPPPSLSQADQLTVAQLDTLKKEIELKVEAKYKEKFAQEIQRAEERVAKVLEQEEEKRAQERISLLEELKRERTSYQKQLDDAFQERLQAELAAAEAAHAEKLQSERRAAEDEVRQALEQQYQSAFSDLRAAEERARAELLEQQQQALDDARQHINAEYQERLREELRKTQDSLGAEKQNALEQLNQQLQASLEKEYQQRLEEEKSAIEQRFQERASAAEQSHVEKLQKAIVEREGEFEDRIAALRAEEQQRHETEVAAIREQLAADYKDQLEKSIAEERRQYESEVQHAQRQKEEELDRERTKVSELERATVERVRAEIRQEMEEEFARRLSELQESFSINYEYKMSLLGIDIPQTEEDRLALYRDRLRDAWSSGSLTMEKAQQLMELQDILGIDFETHAIAEAEVRLNMYANIVEEMILSGTLKPTDTDKLDELKQQFDITVEESANLEPLILTAFQRATTRGTIFVADDDESLLRIIELRLKEEGYQVVTTSRITGALDLVQATPVDLILCDVRFEGEKVDGFTFFKQCFQHERIQRIPFIFMSSLDEGLFIRTGIQLGVDDYLTKPLDLDLLTATIEGKLKKYKVLRST